MQVTSASVKRLSIACWPIMCTRLTNETTKTIKNLSTLVLDNRQAWAINILGPMLCAFNRNINYIGVMLLSAAVEQ
jgi:hypothetical protein